MKYKKLDPKEEGYLLLESVLTLVILMAVMISLCPLAVDWLSKHQESKSLVEESRQLYERSIGLNNQLPGQEEADRDSFQSDKNGIRIKATGTEVVIYESIFKK